METIWKFHIPTISPDVVIEVPRNSLALHAGTQWNKAYIWFVVRKDFIKDLVPFRLKVIMTGEDVDLTGCEHLGTFMLDEGAFVAHVFVPRGQK